MSDNWLDHGHGDDPSRLPPVFSRVPSGPGGAGGRRSGPSSGGRRAWVAGPWVVAIVTAVAVVGSVGAAYAIRENLFPSLGAPTTQSVWQNPVAPDEAPPSSPPTEISSTSTTSSTTSTLPASVVEDTPAPDATSPSSTATSGRGGGDDGDDGSGPGAPPSTASGVPTTVDDHGGGPGPDDGSGSGSVQAPALDQGRPAARAAALDQGPVARDPGPATTDDASNAGLTPVRRGARSPTVRPACDP